MQPGTSAPNSSPQRNTAGLFIRLALVVSLVALAISLAKFFKQKPAEETRAVEQDGTELSETPPPAPRRSRPPFRPTPQARLVPTTPAQPMQPVQQPGPSVERWVTNDVWGSTERPARPGFLMAARLTELSTRTDGGMFSQFEPPVFYQVALSYGTELSNRLADIRTSTNAINQFISEFKELSVSAERDHRDYVQQAKLANSQRRTEAAAAMKKLTELQTLYLERKREFQQESARLKPQLQDPPAQFEAKLALYQKAAAAYEIDINQLEAAMHALQKQNQTTAETLGAQDQNIEKAYELSAADVLGQLNVLSNRVQSKLGEVNASIRDYNARLAAYGSPLPSSR
jgi:hypothetical protein